MKRKNYSRQEWSDLSVDEWTKITGITKGSKVKFIERIWDWNDDVNEEHPKGKVTIGVVDELFKSNYGGIGVFFKVKGKSSRELYSTMSQDVRMILLND